MQFSPKEGIVSYFQNKMLLLGIKPYFWLWYHGERAPCVSDYCTLD